LLCLRHYSISAGVYSWEDKNGMYTTILKITLQLLA
jgi:hypothetical protein